MGIVHSMTDAERIAYLEAQIAKLQKANQGKLTLKVSTKGAVSVYGMGRWPVTLYQSQWARLLSAKAQIEEFIEANSASLASKDSD